MNKASIKIIKRKNSGEVESIKTRDTREKKSVATTSGENVERRLYRQMTDTVSNWIAERRANKRSDELSAFRKFFGDEHLSGAPA